MTSDLVREMEQQQADAQRHALDLVNAIALLNSQIKPLEGLKARAVDELKEYLLLNDLTELVDGETGAAAKLQDRTSAETFDLVRASERDPEAVLEAGHIGALSADSRMLDRHSGAGWIDVLRKYRMPGRITTALYVEGKDKAK